MGWALVARKPRKDGLGTERSLASVAGMLEEADVSTGPAILALRGAQQHAKAPEDVAVVESGKQHCSANSMKRPNIAPPDGRRERRGAWNHVLSLRGEMAVFVLATDWVT